MTSPGVAGCFGKVRGNGDFVTRRLPPCFVESWDAIATSVVNPFRRAPLEQFRCPEHL
ncbi:hypothetical protein AWB74_05725 [Caballeronia arvi]|uniref:Uncharacterized protein n=1 Tax=Caballeronia arvi TaxID=1777135 RepID=A0A158KH69_9BURK|nr:TagF domain-containing protein [Caballeronia arvi]SAL80447.1 hypothetical protein AWB74_05725 [Caballeronia arvi]